MRNIGQSSFNWSGAPPRATLSRELEACERFVGACKGRGKRGGCGVIYFWHPASRRLLMLFAFSKNERADLGTEKKMLRQIIDREYR